MKKRFAATFLAALMALTAIVIIPVSAETDGDWKYSYLTNMWMKVSSVKITGYNGSSTVVNIPSSFNTSYGNLPVTDIGNTFQSNGSIKHITIPQGVTVITGGAFKSCISLESITIPDSVTTIAYNAFENCSSLKKITIPNSVTTIRMQAFQNCSSLKKIIISNSVTDIPLITFMGCRSITSIYIPESVVSIGLGNFDDCSSLKTVYYGGSEAKWNKISIGIENRYLKKANIIFNYTPPKPGAGDVNGDGKLNARDITAIMKYMLGAAPKGFNKEAADYNNDGTVNARDITAIMQEILEG